ncbi:MAG TPA: CPBP family intramembrane glutamic endopeptidase [Steroidobacteraceae bacterium]
MIGTPTSAIQVAAPILLMATVLSLWLAPRAWPGLLTLTFLAGCVSGQLTWLAGLWIILLAGAFYAYTNDWPRASKGIIRLLKASSCVGIVILAVGFAIHIVPGFHNTQVLPPTRLTPRSIPYDQWINFDKTIAGILLLAVLYQKLITTAARLKAALKRAVAPTLVTIACVIVLGWVLGYIRWDPKWTSQFWLWADINLLGTCMSEEAFFRAFLQIEIERLTAKRRKGAIIAILCSAVLFGLAHMAGGWRYVVLASVAGAGYGTVFYRTRSIEASILAHFTLNVVHFLLFTYPAAAA